MTGSSSMGVSQSKDKRVALSERIRQRHSCVLQFEELLRQFSRCIDFLIATGRLQTELSNDLFFRVVLPAEGDDLSVTGTDFAQVFHQLREECFEDRFFLNIYIGIRGVETNGVAVLIFVSILEGCELDEVLTALEARKVLCTSGTALAAVLLAAKDRKAFVIPSENASAGAELRVLFKVVVDAAVVEGEHLVEIRFVHNHESDSERNTVVLPGSQVLRNDRVVALEFRIRDQYRCEHLTIGYGASIKGTVLGTLVNSNLWHNFFLL